MDTIREWISDNLRYILLGAVLILVIIAAIAGVRAINNLGAGKTPKPVETEAESTSDTDVIVDSNSTSGGAADSLVLNDPKVLTVMTSYYAAKTNKDLETLKKLEPSVSEAEQQANLDNNYYIESYSNIKTYSKAGPEAGSCVVYVCYDGKVKDINTLVPSLTQFYLKTDAEGNYYIADVTGDAKAEAFIEEMRKSSEVQALIESVDKDCEDAKNSDPVLKQFMNEHGSSQSSDTKQTEADQTAGTGDQTTLAANDSCNVRTEPNTDSDANIIGGLAIGDVVTKTGETDDGWTEIDYDGQTAYVKSEFLSPQDEVSADAAENTDTAEDAAGDEGADAAASDADYFSPEYTNEQ